MDYIKIEQKAKTILRLRKERADLQEEINKHVNEIMALMDEEKRRIFKTGNYSLEIAQRIKRDINFDLLDKAVNDGLIPESAFKKSHYRRLLITSSHLPSGQKMTLKGNKFVVE